MYRCYESSRTKKSGRTSSNLYLQLKWDLINYENHRYNVKTAKHSIDNKAPLTYSHLYYRPKKLQLELERFCTIQRTNKSLMQRIATIQREGAWIDNKNFHEIKSLNTWKRQQEMIELAYNNQAMLSRLLDSHTTYNKRKIEDEYLVFQKHKANVQKFPKDWRNIVQQMKLMKKHITEMVIAMRTGKYKPEMEKRVQRKALEKEALELQKAERAAEAAASAEEKKRLEQEKCSHALREMRKGREKSKEESRKWRDVREERLRLLKEKREVQERVLEQEKLSIEESKRKRREGTKKKLQEWKTLEAELKVREERKKREEEDRRRRIAKRRKEAKERQEKAKELKQEGHRGRGLDRVETSTVKSSSDEGSTDYYTEIVLIPESEDSQSSSGHSFTEEEGKGLVDEESSEKNSGSKYEVTHEGELEEVSLPPDSEKTEATPKTENDESDSFVLSSSRQTTDSSEGNGFDDIDSSSEWYSDESFGVGETVEEPSSLVKVSETEKSGACALKKDVVEELDGKGTKQTPQEREDQRCKESGKKADDGSGSLQIEKEIADDQKANAAEKSGAGGNPTEDDEDESLDKKIAKGMMESSEKKHKD